jgi:pilus assembly protein CpaE
LATNIAAVVARLEQRCALLDLHWRGGDLTTLLNIHPRHTLQSLAGKSDQLDRTMFEHSLVRHDSGVQLLASPEPFNDYRQIRPELIQKIVQLARATFPTVIADLEDCEHHDQARTLAISDRIVVPMRPDFVSLVRTKKLIHHLLSSGVTRDHVKLVVNRVGRPKELPIGQIEKTLEMPISFQIPDDPVAVNEAINLGMPLVVNSPHSKTASIIVRLAESLLNNSANTLSANASAQTVRGLFFPFKSVTRLFGVVST